MFLCKRDMAGQLAGSEGFDGGGQDNVVSIIKGSMRGEVSEVTL